MFIIVDNELRVLSICILDVCFRPRQMNAIDALMYVFLFSVVSKMSHSELNFPCPVTA